jgi:hypothetical protein
MQALFENQYITIFYDPKTGILYNVWFPETLKMSDKMYKENALLQIQYMRVVRSSRWLVDLSMFKYMLNADIRQWVNAQLPQVVMVGVKYIALVNSSDIFAQISVEQLMMGKNILNANFEIRYFEDRKKAEKWLITK